MENIKTPIFLKDYKKLDFLISNVNLDFEILVDKIIVNSDLKVVNVNSANNTLILYGEDLTTTNIKINDTTLTNNDYEIIDNTLIIKDVSNYYNSNKEFNLKITVDINPYTNTKLMGIYKSQGGLFSQCEPEGFRRITWFLDRPDNMATWIVKIKGDKSIYPTILSNGNMIKEEVIDNYLIRTFHDIYPKPSYLFAFVAGNFDKFSDQFITKSGNKVDINVYVELGKKQQAAFAAESLKKSMKWDEDTYKLEYELNVFSIVAVSDFNFGAMENKSLNIFNEAYVLADPFIATDDDYFNIESIVAHEYFHNFTGDRITCRDWFQLTLKEGLTVYRDHKFSESLYDFYVVRIGEVERLKTLQYPEDAGALSHPIRPLSYIEMNNFYTATVYEKGAEVVRMVETIIGEDNFKKGIDVYFEKFDSQAVTCEDFIYAMEVASKVDLTEFKKWYQQSGTPIVNINTHFENNTFTIKLEQINNPTADQKTKVPLVIPLRMALLNVDNKSKFILNDNHYNEVSTKSNNMETILLLDSNTKEYTFNNIKTKPILSINRRFSAPIILNQDLTDEELLHIINYDDDGYIRYESLQSYLKKYMVNIINLLDKGSYESNKELIDKNLKAILIPYKELINTYKNNVHLTSLLFKLPSFSTFEMLFKTNLPIKAIYDTIFLVENTVSFYHNELYEIFKELKDDETVFDGTHMGIRSFKNRILYYLLKSNNNYEEVLLNYYNNTKSMTKKFASLLSVRDYKNNILTEQIFDKFYQEYKGYATSINKWLALNASALKEDTLNKVKLLIANNEVFNYNNPNKVRALIGSFANNNFVLHNVDGSGYKFLVDTILHIDTINSSISAGIAKVFAKILTYKKENQNLIRTIVVDEILSRKDISKGLFEIITKVKEQK